MLNFYKMWNVVGFFFVSLFILLSNKAYAQTYQLQGNYFVRSSMDFLSLSNKIGVLHEGSTFRVINRIEQSNGAEALEIQVTAMTEDSYLKPSPTGKMYIYKNNEKHFLNRSKPEINSTTSEAAIVDQCPTCKTAAEKNLDQVRKNRSELAIIASEVEEIANIAPPGKKPEHLPVSPTTVSRPGNLDEQIQKYSESNEVKKTIEWAMKNKKSKSRGKCYRSVKEALATQCGPNVKNHSCTNAFAPIGGKKGPGNNLVPNSYSDEAALNAKNSLKKFGFVNLLELEPYKSQITSANQAPKGAVLVYSSGIPCRESNIPDCGHTEIKVSEPGKPGFVSDFYSTDPINETPRARRYGSNYKLVGIMIKP